MMRRSGLFRWFFANTLLAGFFALCWLVLRSGPRPSRLTYPCQQAAISTATLAFGAPLVATVLALRRQLARLQSPVGVAAAAFGLLFTFGAWGYLSRLEASRGPQLPPLQAAAEYRAEVFHVSDCPQDPVGDRFPCIDTMLNLMGSQGLKFYDTPTDTPTSGPSGIIAAEDTIVIKINYQWAERGGTNTDLLQGLIRSIVDHPAGFTGEIVVGENTQFASAEDFNRTDNNAQDRALSPYDVVAHFQGLGHNVSLSDWASIRLNEVAEYSQGDFADGYVRYPFDPQLNGAVSYPKFQTRYRTLISLRDGIWNPASGSYNREHLKLINLPVLKSHFTYGVTANVKNYMGVVTTALGTNSHFAMRNGVLGAQLGVIRLADLNILDAIWINAHPDGGPSTGYSEATRRDELVASTDPAAADLWATKNILVPAFEDNGYDEWPKADPDDPSSDFREYLDNSTFFVLSAGLEVTSNPEQIDLFGTSWPLHADGFETGDTSAWSETSP